MAFKNTKSISKITVVIIILCALLISTVVIFALEKLGYTSFFSEQKTPSQLSQTGEIPSANPTNTVDYGPPDETDTQSVPDKDSNFVPEPTANDMSVIITRTSASQDGTKYLIKATVTGTNSGTCAVKMTSAEKSISDSGSIILSAGQYSCGDLEIPMSSLTNGIWNVEVTATDSSGQSASATSEVTI